MEDITIKDIAKKCGVGVSTVSRAMNNHPDINPKTKDMIMQVIKETGFAPNNNARNLKRTDAKCIALLVKGIGNPFFTKMIQVIEEETKNRKYAMVLRHVDNSEDEVAVAMELIKEKRLRGIVFLGGTFYHDREVLERLNVPFIFSTIGISEVSEEERQAYSNIAVDDKLESKRMTDYLLDLGHKKIAIIAEGPRECSVGQLRLEGYLKAFADRGLETDPDLIVYVDEKIERYSMENGYLTAQKLLKTGKDFTAIFAIADNLAMGACRAMIEAGKEIPRDVTVVGFDGIDAGKYYNPQLTTMKQPVADMAKKTISLLLDVIAGKKQHEHILFPAELVIRESSAGASRQLG